MFNRKPQTYNVPRYSKALEDPVGTRAGYIVCRPGFSLSTRDEVSRAGLDRMNPHPNTLRLVWIAPSDPPSRAYTTLRDLGEADTLFAIAGTHELKVLNALAGAENLSPVVRETAHARAESIRTGKPSALGMSVARDESDGMMDMGRL